jgi:6-phosphofructokinase 2
MCKPGNIVQLVPGPCAGAARAHGRKNDMAGSVQTLTLNPAIDSNWRLDELRANRKTRTNNPRVDPGGGGVNVSRAMRTLGCASTAVVTAGGLRGERLRRLLREEEVPCRVIDIAGETRENVTVSENSSGRQYRLTSPGPHVEEREWRACLDALTGSPAESSGTPRYIVASGSLPDGVPEDVYARLIHAARERGDRVVVDTSGPALRAAAGEGAYLLKPNLRELRTLVDDDGSGRGAVDARDLDVRDAAAECVERGLAEIVLVSLGGDGAVIASTDGVIALSAPEVVVESRIGAGDSMVAGAVSALARGRGVEEAARLAVAAGSAAVMTRGTELCRRQDVEHLLDGVVEA